MLPTVSNPELLGPDPESTYFADSDGRPVPLVVEHATGNPAFAVVDGALVPYATWKGAAPAPAAVPKKGFTIKSGNGGLVAGIKVG